MHKPRYGLLLVAALVVHPACANEPRAAVEEKGGGAIAPAEVGLWHQLLMRHQRDGGVDYAGVAADREPLDAYLRELAGARSSGAPREDQVAFWLNAYNAAVLHQVLDRYPDIPSVKEVDGFFNRLTTMVAGEELTLDEIEDRARDLGDPRVHFAVVCASTSCPGLRHEPYRGADLDAQLEEQTREFLSDRSKGLRYDAQSNELWLSSIFKWYAGDFTGGSTVVAFFARGKVAAWLMPHLPESLAKEIREREPSVKYLDYDWSLNDRPGA